MGVGLGWLVLQRSRDPKMITQLQKAVESVHIHFLEAREQTRTQMGVSSKMARNIRIITQVQKMVEWIEIFLVSVYAAHLTHMVADALDWHGAPAAGAIAGAALVSGVLAALVLKPWQHGDNGH